MTRNEKLKFSDPTITLPVTNPENVTDDNAEDINEFYTIDGHIINASTLTNALQTGKGLMIGGFFVGTTLSSDMLFACPGTL